MIDPCGLDGKIDDQVNGSRTRPSWRALGSSVDERARTKGDRGQVCMNTLIPYLSTSGTDWQRAAFTDRLA